EADIDVRADIYGLGVIFYEMLTGRVPFFGPAAQVRLGHQGLRPPRPSELAAISPALEEMVLRCLAKQRQRRFQEIPALPAALQGALLPDGEQPVAEHSSVAREAAPAGRRETEAARESEKRLVGVVYLITQGEALSQNRVQQAGGHLAHVA